MKGSDQIWSWPSQSSTSYHNITFVTVYKDDMLPFCFSALLSNNLCSPAINFEQIMGLRTVKFDKSFTVPYWPQRMIIILEYFSNICIIWKSVSLIILFLASKVLLPSLLTSSWQLAKITQIATFSNTIETELPKSKKLKAFQISVSDIYLAY